MMDEDVLDENLEERMRLPDPATGAFTWTYDDILAAQAGIGEMYCKGVWKPEASPDAIVSLCFDFADGTQRAVRPAYMREVQRAWDAEVERLCIERETQTRAREARLVAAENLCDCWEAYEDVLKSGDSDEEETAGHFARCSVAWMAWDKAKGDG